MSFTIVPTHNYETVISTEFSLKSSRMTCPVALGRVGAFQKLHIEKTFESRINQLNA
jgi:hypothetical protein